MLGGKQLSAKEQAFAQEVKRLEHSVLGASAAPEVSQDLETTPHSSQQQSIPLSSRLETVRSLQQTLVEQVNDASDRFEKSEKNHDSTDRNANVVGTSWRKQRLAQVMTYLERETALIDAVMERLQRLQKFSV